MTLQFRKPYVSECRAEQNCLWRSVSSGRVPSVPVDVVRGSRMMWKAGWQGRGRRGGGCLPGGALARCWGLEGPSQCATETVPAWAGFPPVTTSCLLRPLAPAVRAGDAEKGRRPEISQPREGGQGSRGERVLITDSAPPPPAPHLASVLPGIVRALLPSNPFGCSVYHLPC